MFSLGNWAQPLRRKDCRYSKVGQREYCTGKQLFTLLFLKHNMIRPSIPTIGLIILLIGYTVAEADSERSRRAVPSSACQEQTSLHNRLDVVEKKVEDTVGKLEVELAALLEAIEDPEWRSQLDNTGKPVGILEEPEHHTSPKSDVHGGT